MSTLDDENDNVDEYQSTRARLLPHHDRTNSTEQINQSNPSLSNTATRMSISQSSNPSPYSSGRWTVAFLALFSTICTLTGLILLDPHLVTSVMDYSMPISNSNDLSQSIVSPMSHHIMSINNSPPPCHATIEEIIPRLINQSSTRDINQKRTLYLLYGCAMEQSRTPPHSCAAHHTLESSLLMLSMVVKLSIDERMPVPVKYMAGTFFDHHTDWDQFIGLNEGETHLIDVTIDARTPMENIDHQTINRTTEVLIERSFILLSSTIYHINAFSERELHDEFLSADRSLMSYVSAILAAKYCYARSLRPQTIDLFARERYHHLLDHDSAALHEFIPYHLTYDIKSVPLIIAVACNNTSEEVINHALHATYQTVSLIINQQPAVQAVSVHLFFEYLEQPVDTLMDQFVKGYQAIKQLLVNQANKQPFNPSFNIHSRPATSKLHHFITSDVFIGDASPLSYYASYARYQRLTVSPVYIPLDSVVMFNQTSNEPIEPTPFTRSLSTYHLLNAHKFRTKRECQDILSEYEIKHQMAAMELPQ